MALVLNRLRKLGNLQHDILFVLALLVCALILTRQAANIVDLDCFDESMYVTFASRFHATVAEWSPLYVRFLSGYFLFLSDPTQVYYFNVAVIALLLSPAIYLLARRLGANPLPAFVASSLFLISGENLPLVPKVQHFSALLTLLALLFCDLAALSPALVFGMLSIFSVWMSYVRPELQFLVPIFLALFLWQERRKRRIACVLGANLASAVICYWWFHGAPLGERSWGAFVASFATSYRFRFPAASSLGDERIFSDAFGAGVHSVPAALFRNPPACFGHWFWNLRLFGRQLLAFCSSHYALFDLSARWLDFLLFYGSLGALAIFAVLRAWRARPSLDRRGALLLSLLLFCVPSAAIGLVYLPWERYLLMLLIAGLVLLAVFASRRGSPFLVSVLVGGLAIMATPRAPDLTSGHLANDTYLSVVKTRDEVLRRVEQRSGSSPECVVFPYFVGIHFRCHMVEDQPVLLGEDPGKLRAYVEKNKPGFVFVSVGRHSSEHELALIEEKRAALAKLRDYEYSKVGGENPEVFWGHLWIHR